MREKCDDNSKQSLCVGAVDQPPDDGLVTQVNAIKRANRNPRPFQMDSIEAANMLHAQ